MNQKWPDFCKNCQNWRGEEVEEDPEICNKCNGKIDCPPTNWIPRKDLVRLMRILENVSNTCTRCSLKKGCEKVQKIDLQGITKDKQTDMEPLCCPIGYLVYDGHQIGCYYEGDDIVIQRPLEFMDKRPDPIYCMNCGKRIQSLEGVKMVQHSGQMGYVCLECQ